MTITIKSGVPGSGKTQSMVADLFDYLSVMKKTGIVRPIYTNITGLDQAVIPHFPMLDMPDGSKPFERVPGVMYTIDWQDCPPESIIVIDEAQKNGFDATSSQKSVPLHVAQLAVHRKDFSVDIWFITQHPKLLHMGLRRQCSKHQHYERKFALKRAFCFEWHECQDNLLGKKNAVLSQFAFSKKFQSAYHSADVHTKTKFSWPLWIWLPLIVVPLGAVVAPRAYATLTGAIAGKGISPQVPKNENSTISTLENGFVVTKTVSTAPAFPASGPVSASVHPAPAPINPPPVQVISGCISTPKKCGCFDDKGASIEIDVGVCQSKIMGMAMPGQKVDLSKYEDQSKPIQRLASVAEDADVLAFMTRNRASH